MTWVADYFNQTISIKRQKVDADGNTLYNADGTPQFETATIKGRFVEDRRLVRDASGREVVSEAKLSTIEAIRPDDRVVDDGREYAVLHLAKARDVDGVFSHYVVRL